MQSLASSYPKPGAQAMGHGVYSVAHCPAILFPDCLAATDIDRLTDCVECLVGVGAQRRNGCNAHHDDQGQHYGILNGRRAVFGFDKIEGELCELGYVFLVKIKGETTVRLRW